MEADEWKFRGEGNAFLVLTNTRDGMVYRFAKTKHWRKGLLSKCNKNEKNEVIHEEMKLVVDYMKNVMRPLLGCAFVELPVLKDIAGGLPFSESEIKGFRPAQRKGQHVKPCTIHPATLSALVMPDLCFVRGGPAFTSPTISVEIKPKKAFMHVHSTDTPEEKSLVCKFCMHQRLKAKTKQWSETSKYCPLDLFSGNRRRMKQALIALAHTPQNNLRICQDGEEVHGACRDGFQGGELCCVLQEALGVTSPVLRHNGYSKSDMLVQVFLDLILETLLYVPDQPDVTRSQAWSPRPANVQSCQNSLSQSESFKQDEVYSIPEGCVLERILSIQSRDRLDIDGIYPIYTDLVNQFKQSPGSSITSNLDGPYDQGDWLAAMSQDGCDLIIEQENPVNKVKQFFVSKTVQDCSIMVALQKVPASCNEKEVGPCVTLDGGQRVRFSVTVVDLDPKPFCKIETYHNQDEEIVNEYRETSRDVQ
ncbi:inositol-pentakisphosphate 2-kinase-like [Dreissena polymorpha]|uniref:Inositol-pentakisphosphate 2-kinase n=1 Tax=Dreissena polymorpha TaxID=45954 RepID=A0A9D4GRV2_DREPO|nr:inositol-pentakisphosphate 2-kinase-like [Dreissena polymorpha]KAH3820350.1 hypothetical protein DPMN_122096 [Dreissena polymorpha]